MTRRSTRRAAKTHRFSPIATSSSVHRSSQAPQAAASTSRQNLSCQPTQTTTRRNTRRAAKTSSLSRPSSPITTSSSVHSSSEAPQAGSLTLQQPQQMQPPSAQEEQKTTIFWRFRPDPQRCWTLQVSHSQFHGQCDHLFPLFLEHQRIRDHREYKGMQIRPTDIMLYKTKEPVPEGSAWSREWLRNQALQEIEPGTALSDVLPNGVVEGQAIVVDISESAESRAAVSAADSYNPLNRYKMIIESASRYGPPSTVAQASNYIQNQADPATVIHDGIYVAGQCPTIAPPIELFHPIFGELHALISDPKFGPSEADAASFAELCSFLALQFGSDEERRNEGILYHLTTLINRPITERRSHGSTSLECNYFAWASPPNTPPANGSPFLDGHCPILTGVFKNLGGRASGDPRIQAGLSMKVSWCDDLRAFCRERCCCPTFIIAGSGPCLTVMGGVITDKVIIQPLAPTVSVTRFSTHDGSHMLEGARIFTALRICLEKLEEYYRSISKLPSCLPDKTTHPRFFPYPTTYKTLEGHMVRFNYIAPLKPWDDCIVFHAHTIEPKLNKGKDIVVKFVARYGVDVHQALAKDEHAPRLLSFTPLHETPPSLTHIQSSASSGWCVGPLMQVVMEYVEPAPQYPGDAYAQVENVLCKLHAKGFVFGDLQASNILFSTDGKVKFIDFDWAGKRGDQPGGVQYPYDMNLGPNTVWTGGAFPFRPILQAHDQEMLAHLQYQYPDPGSK